MDARPFVRSNSWPWATAVIVVTLAAGALGAFWIFSRKTGELSGNLIGGLKQMFKTEIVVTNHSYTLKTDRVAKLTLVERQAVVYSEYSVPGWLGSEAVALFRGVYKLGVGYDLNQFQIEWDRLRNVLAVQVPEPVVTVEKPEGTKTELLFSQRDLFKDIEPEDTVRAIASNEAAARDEAIQFGILQDAREQLKERLQDTLGSVVEEIILTYPDGTTDTIKGWKEQAASPESQTGMTDPLKQ